MSQAIRHMTNAAAKALDLLRFRKRDYQATFCNPRGQDVLRDLAHFCRANETCFHPDARIHAVAEGRREVWLRIQHHLGLNSEQLLAIYAGKTLQFTETEKDDG